MEAPVVDSNNGTGAAAWSLEDDVSTSTEELTSGVGGDGGDETCRSVQKYFWNAIVLWGKTPSGMRELNHKQ